MTVYLVGYSGSQLTAGFLIKVSFTFLISDVHPLYPTITVHLSLVTRKLTPFSRLIHLCYASLKADSHVACHSPAMLCREVFRMCLFHMIYTVRPCLIHTCHAMSPPCLKAMAQCCCRETACGLPAHGWLLSATMRSSTKVLRSIPILLTAIRAYNCKEHTTRKTVKLLG
jgi:hypothetical protein